MQFIRIQQRSFVFRHYTVDYLNPTNKHQTIQIYTIKVFNSELNLIYHNHCLTKVFFIFNPSKSFFLKNVNFEIYILFVWKLGSQRII